jgi:hypothetical protein
MRRATLIVAVAALLVGFAPLVSPAPRVLLLTLAAIAMTAAAFRDYGRVAALATLVAFTSSAVVLLGGLSAARPAAGSLPTAGVLWWWPLAVGGLFTRFAGRWGIPRTILVALVVASTFVLFLDALSDDVTERTPSAPSGLPVLSR